MTEKRIREIVIVIWLTEPDHEERVATGLAFLLQRLKENKFVKDFELTAEDVNIEENQNK